jgi:hypothetical protein
MPLLTQQVLRRRLREAIAHPKYKGNQSLWARDNGLTPQQVSLFLNKKCNPGKIASALGFKEVLRYKEL